MMMMCERVNRPRNGTNNNPAKQPNSAHRNVKTSFMHFILNFLLVSFPISTLDVLEHIFKVT